MNEVRWTLVTGGAKGLGAEICKTLAEQGHNVLIHYNSSHNEALKIREACRKYGSAAQVIHGNFSSMELVNQFLANLQKEFPNSIAGLVNNVGNYYISPAIGTSDEEWVSLFQTNLHAPVAIMRALMPTFVELKGAIINIGVVGINHVPAEMYSTAYTASKLALWMTSKSIAKEFGSQGVRVNMVSPGVLENSIDKDQMLDFIPMRRYGSFSEVARLVAFLLTEENSYITGQNIEVGGGIRL